ncbi:hypothetical protein Pint_10771 [Pistacia integerrima]|uniref:Uncharacterized protein n=1 Tax=Pistacia integerrima TaxID=434235 RepID=A0ACC0XDS7_9ROSI|nr:hypothetical protein Pint_10771 [Pistacia integerrima]
MLNHRDLLVKSTRANYNDYYYSYGLAVKP